MDRRVYKQSAEKQRHHSVTVHQQLISHTIQRIQSTMKCFVAVLLLALFAIVMAVEQVPEVKKVVSAEKETQVDDATRDKRGLGAYAPLSYAAPYTYSSYSLPYAYPPYAYSYYRYPYYRYYNSPYYV